eukprot:scaffold185405_cov33-Tisochrysis_lutea.AAC.1
MRGARCACERHLGGACMTHDLLIWCGDPLRLRQSAARALAHTPYSPTPTPTRRRNGSLPRHLGLLLALCVLLRPLSSSSPSLPSTLETRNPLGDVDTASPPPWINALKDYVRVRPLTLSAFVRSCCLASRIPWPVGSNHHHHHHQRCPSSATLPRVASGKCPVASAALTSTLCERQCER